MNTADAKRLQSRLGVTADGVIGRGTLTTLFMKFGAGLERAAELALSANVHFTTYYILDKPLRLAHFMAQLIHESGNFRYMEEIASGKAYEGRRDLGNVRPGDGMLYKGRGPIQLTGRTNYRDYGRRAGIDFERHPGLVATPSIGLMVACMFWDNNGLNELADDDDIKRITLKINGGLNGYADRQARLKAMKALLL